MLQNLIMKTIILKRTCRHKQLRQQNYAHRHRTLSRTYSFD
uniref:Uncharacterized protein n=1 Tax=Rhizophora mucronata TaxID=61149 RepID=A0A2P2P2I9_RHIMU